MESNTQADFPLIYRDFVKMFPDVAACASYLERLRWPDGFVCPVCQHRQEPWRQTRERMVCPACRHQCTVTAETPYLETLYPKTKIRQNTIRLLPFGNCGRRQVKKALCRHPDT